MVACLLAPSLRGGTAGCSSTWLQSPIIREADRCLSRRRMAPVFTGTQRVCSL